MPDLDLATMAKEVADRIDRRNLVMAFGGLAHETWAESAVPEILAALQRVQAETRPIYRVTGASLVDCEQCKALRAQLAAREAELVQMKEA